MACGGPLAGKGGATQRGGGDAHGDKTGGSLTDEDRKDHARVDGRAHARDQNISPLRARGECQQPHDARDGERTRHYRQACARPLPDAQQRDGQGARAERREDGGGGPRGRHAALRAGPTRSVVHCALIRAPRFAGGRACERLSRRPDAGTHPAQVGGSLRMTSVQPARNIVVSTDSGSTGGLETEQGQAYRRKSPSKELSGSKRSTAHGAASDTGSVSRSTAGARVRGGARKHALHTHQPAFSERTPLTNGPISMTTPMMP
ncbi:hypothetical protein AcW1_003849 [Taiwanofungus camphoratus]|nr:hypothetical protein AcW1_003849 [Antrodia cinnamomea]